MAKVLKLDDGNGTCIHVFFCPACGYNHHADKRWTFNGDFDRPTFSPSFLVHKGLNHPQCHSFVTDGKIQYLGDCDHEMAGQTVELPDEF